MPSLAAVLDRIRRAAAKKSRLAFARLAGLPESIVRGLDRDDWNPQLRTLIAAEKAARLVEEQEAGS